MTIVDYYFHSPSPWAYLAGPRFNELIKKKKTYKLIGNQLICL